MTGIREATIDDCDRMGLITVSASFATFVGNIPEELMDFEWPPEASAKNWREKFAEFTDRGQRMLVVEEEGRVVGFVWSKPWADMPGYDSSIQGLYVLPSRHGRGYGRQLVQAAVGELVEAGHRRLEIGCVRENPSCGFYRHLGGREIGERPVKVDEFETVELFFGWDDASVIVEGGS